MRLTWRSLPGTTTPPAYIAGGVIGGAVGGRGGGRYFLVFAVLVADQAAQLAVLPFTRSYPFAQ